MSLFRCQGTSTLSFSFLVEAKDEDEAFDKGEMYLKRNGSSDTDILGEDDFEVHDVQEEGQD
jgi:hypothetical protein